MTHPERLLGTSIAQHHVTRLLGSGRFADVYEVWTPAGERRAMKLLRHALDPRSKAAARLAQEAQAVATIEHVNVVGYHGGGLFEGRLWILVERVDGSDLRKLADAAGGTLPPERLLGIVRQACEGVAAAHRRKILHRDLKPENILVNLQGVAKVADFGSAKLAAWGVQTTAEEEVSSALYRAPETVRRRMAVRESDVFSMGVLLYELLSGTHPFCNEPLPVMAVSRRLLDYVPPPPLATLGRDIPHDISDLVQRALSSEPEDRTSMRGLADALEAAQQPLLVRRRASAQSLPVPDQDARTARTEPALPQMIPRAAALGVASERRTTLPMAPMEPVTAPSEVRRGPAATVPMAVWEPGPPDDRRSTGIPVETAAPRPSAAAAAAVSSRRVSLVVTAGAVVVGAGIAVAGWFLMGDPRPTAAVSAAPSASGRADAGAAGSASALPPRGGPPGAKGPGRRTQPIPRPARARGDER